METKKEESIRKEYGEYWEQLSQQAKKCDLEHNGYIPPIISGIGNIPREFVTFNDLCFRPRTIVGIEHNNGWIRIESEEDLPKDQLNGDLFEVGLLDDEGNFTHERKRCSGKSVKWMWDKKLITHYQPIVKPKPPIY